MAEWSKAPDSSSGLRKGAWVRTPLLTNSPQLFCSLSVSRGDLDSNGRFAFSFLRLKEAQMASSCKEQLLVSIVLSLP
ncbi:hypothetical protein CY35_10G081500 [Sphagnum magellanicum]|nr:hypothetical protein CY35_10G081500 [Sphagnum magellanicum]